MRRHQGAQQEVEMTLSTNKFSSANATFGIHVSAAGAHEE
jgi:hypothetical protein